MPWAYASIVDPKYFPKGANLEQVDVMQLGKSVNFCVAPFDGAPLCKIGDDRSVFASKDQANQLSHNLCRVLRHKIGNCRGSVFRCDEGGWVDIDAVIDDRNNDIFPPFPTFNFENKTIHGHHGSDQVAGVRTQEIEISGPGSKVSKRHEPE